ncbi:MAG: outer membrane lipoprotein carrier protein LolA [Desulfobacteraceae bacterium]|nr:outer membrane lipoprotein carrier protein LolA [Desulfobacteraceae bacterium]
MNYLTMKILIPVLVSCLICASSFRTITMADDTSLSLEQIISKMEKKYRGKSFSANFTQRSRLAALEITEKASGRAFFSHPGKMKWEYQAPEHHTIITNSKKLWLWRPDENQVMTGDARQFFQSGAGGVFLSDITLVRQKFNILIKEITDSYVELGLTAKKESPDITTIVIRLSKQTHEIQQVVTYNAYDDTTFFEFSNIQFKPLDDALFEFQIPEGSDIIYMDE